MHTPVQVYWHIQVSNFLRLMDGGGTDEKAIMFWALKALVQLIDLQIYHARGKVAKAKKALLPGRHALLDWLFCIVQTSLQHAHADHRGCMVEEALSCKAPLLMTSCTFGQAEIALYDADVRLTFALPRLPGCLT